MNVADSVFEKLCALIADGSLQQGQRVPAERKLAALLGVSRPSVREAMRRLHTLGMIRTRVGSGSYLTNDHSSFSKYIAKRQTASRYKLMELLESRRILECEIVYLAALRMTPNDKENLSRILARMENPSDTESFIKDNFLFHETIALISNNFLLLEMLLMVKELVLGINRAEMITQEKEMRISLHHHRQIHAALMAEDPIAAKKAMLIHINGIINTAFPDMLCTETTTVKPMVAPLDQAE